MRQVRASAILGSASLISMGVGLLKIKIFAVLIGPSGMGLIGLFQNIIATVATIAGLGLNNVGTRQIALAAAATNRAEELAITKKALFLITVVASSIGFISMLTLAPELLPRIEGVNKRVSENFVLALSTVVTILAASQISVLTGLRHTTDLAKISAYSAVLSAIFGVLAIWSLNEAGVVVAVLFVPLSSLIVSSFYTRKLEKFAKVRKSDKKVLAQIGNLSKLGFVFMIGGSASIVAQLMVRTSIGEFAGVEALGQFQAVWQISMLYLGFVLTAMGTEYYPRLTSSISDKQKSVDTVNEQTEIAVLLAAPLLLLMLGASPWVISLLYTEEFKDAARLLSLQVLGDAVKVVSWPIGYVLLATGDAKRFLFAEVLSFGVFVIVTRLALPFFGLTAAGLGFLCLYLVYLPTVYYAAHKKIGFTWTSRNIAYVSILLSACLLLKAVSNYGEVLTFICSALLSVIFAIHTVFRIGSGKLKSNLLEKLMAKIHIKKS